MKTLTIVFLVAPALIALADPATAQVQLQVQLTSDQDREFVRKAAAANVAEVELGRVAQQRAARPSVRAFADRLVADHDRANEELAGLARMKGIEISTTLDPTHAALRDRLSGMSGADFDRAYMSQMVADHIADVAMFEAYTPVATDPDLKTWATRTLPVLREHLTLARTVNSEVVLGPVPAPAPAALPAAVITPWCEGVYAPAGGTNFGRCR